MRFVDDQAVCVEVAFRGFETPFDEVILIVKRAVAGDAHPPERLIRDLPVANASRVTFRKLSEPLVEEMLFLPDVALCPLRCKMSVIQTMCFRFDSIRFTVFEAEIGGGTAVDFRTVFGKTRFPLFRFQIAPVKRERRHIERFRKIFPVSLILFFRIEFVKHEQVGSVMEVMCFLPDLDMRAVYLPAFRVFEMQRCCPFAVLFDSVSDTVFHERFFLLKRLEYITSPGHYECSFFMTIDGRSPILYPIAPWIPMRPGNPDGVFPRSVPR